MSPGLVGVLVLGLVMGAWSRWPRAAASPPAPGGPTPDPEARRVLAGLAGPLAEGVHGRLRIDVVPQVDAFGDDPGLLQLRHGEVRLVAIVSGLGSWGAWDELTAWLLDRLAEDDPAALLASADAFAGRVAAHLRAVPHPAPTHGEAFSLAALLLGPDVAWCVAAGDYSVATWDGAARWLHDGPTVGDLRRRALPPEAPPPEPHPTDVVFLGPVLDRDHPDALAVSGPVPLRPGDCLLIGVQEAVRALAGADATTWAALTAAEVQRRGVAQGRVRHPAVVVHVDA